MPYNLVDLLTAPVIVPGLQYGGYSHQYHEQNPFVYDPAVNPDSERARDDRLLFARERVFAERELGRLLSILSSSSEPVSDYLPSTGESETSPCPSTPAQTQTRQSQPVQPTPTPTQVQEHQMQLARHYRGCDRGLCCVRSMWNDPEYLGHGNCRHKCTISRGRFPICGPPLFPLDLSTLDD